MRSRKRLTYLVVFVDFPHPIFTFVLSDDLSCVFDYDLIRRESAVASNTVAPIHSLDNLDADVILPPSLAPLPQAFEAAICAEICADAAIAIIAFIEHKPIKAVIPTPTPRGADTGRVLLSLGFLPNIGSFTHKHI